MNKRRVTRRLITRGTAPPIVGKLADVQVVRHKHHLVLGLELFLKMMRAHFEQLRELVLWKVRYAEPEAPSPLDAKAQSPIKDK